MKCPNCGRLDQNSRVVDSRPYKHTIKRRRMCTYCSHRWNTFEATETEFSSDRNRNKYLAWTGGEVNTLIMLHFNGVSRMEIARILGRGRMSVSRKLDKLIEAGRYFEVVKERVAQQRSETVN